MSIFVYYTDDYADNGGIGLEEFKSRDDALSFIEKRLKSHRDKSLNCYTFIEGRALTLRAREVATKVEIA